MNKTTNQYINQLNLDAKREAAVRKLVEGAGGVNDSTPLVENLVGNELIPIKQDGENKAVSVEQIKNKVLELPSKYEFVDLGLPSGTKWATCNIGASKPEDSGLYFAWGETQGYTGITDTKKFKWSDYELCRGSSGTLTKYNNNSSYGTVDNLTVLEQVDDAAYTSDNTCRMPTKADFEELTANTTSTWETLNGVNGIRFTSKANGNSIFVPAAGYCDYGPANGVGFGGCLWSSSLNESSPRDGWYLSFSLGNVDIFYRSRQSGLMVRAVKSPNTPTTINLKELKDKINNVEPYIWDGTTSKTIFNELKKANEDNRRIIYNNKDCKFSTDDLGDILLETEEFITYDESNFTGLYIVQYVISSSEVSRYLINPKVIIDYSSSILYQAMYYNKYITQNTTFTFGAESYTRPSNYKINKYQGEFSFGDTVYTVTFPNTVKWSKDSVLEFKPNHTYQFKIVNNLGVMKEFAEILTMTIDANSYNFEKGFTWEDWVNSKYNRGEYYINEYDVIVRQSDGYYLTLSNLNVHASDYIIEKALYNTYYSDSNDDL